MTLSDGGVLRCSWGEKVEKEERKRGLRTE